MSEKLCRSWSDASACSSACVRLPLQEQGDDGEACQQQLSADGSWPHQEPALAWCITVTRHAASDLRVSARCGTACDSPHQHWPVGQARRVGFSPAPSNAKASNPLEPP